VQKQRALGDHRGLWALNGEKGMSPLFQAAFSKAREEKLTPFATDKEKGGNGTQETGHPGPDKTSPGIAKNNEKIAATNLRKSSKRRGRRKRGSRRCCTPPSFLNTKPYETKKTELPSGLLKSGHGPPREGSLRQQKSPCSIGQKQKESLPPKENVSPNQEEAKPADRKKDADERLSRSGAR